MKRKILRKGNSKKVKNWKGIIQNGGIPPKGNPDWENNEQCLFRKRTIQKRITLKKNNSEKGKSEKEQFWKGSNYEKAIRIHKSEKGQFWKGQIWKLPILNKKNCERSNLKRKF